MKDDKYKTCDKCCYDILDDEGDVMEHECISDNELIAEFMGMELGDDRTMYYDDIENLHPPTPINELKFHTSWDWLMPVHKKCMFTPNFQGDDELRTHLIDAVLDADIDRLYNAVVEFIKEYNENERLNNEYVSFNEAPYGQDTEDDACDMLYGVDNNQ